MCLFFFLCKCAVLLDIDFHWKNCCLFIFLLFTGNNPGCYYNFFFFRISKFWSHFLVFCHTHFLFSLLVGNGRAPNFNTISFASSLFLTYYCSSIKAKAIFFVVLCLFSLFYPTVLFCSIHNVRGPTGAKWGLLANVFICS